MSGGMTQMIEYQSKRQKAMIEFERKRDQKFFEFKCLESEKITNMNWKSSSYLPLSFKVFILVDDYIPKIFNNPYNRTLHVFY